ncbi:Phenazine biosynthesis protein PhzF like type [Roseibacterium elongatum DSM 19469]|uniref:Phenazine biosynthesis protein PhzF like type n=1 Tax=Roseicyclus elongatus DSM 19469 TaxID=1294273 RepID=W8SJI4_9RHOB|nr:PhzF family phenazine biosynthesis protein [Roseibacterium elongatum]AHM02665.1 Phenazine biosynthesis protein PhzF like type [Roseibacterium elongatum DSM 19469]
MLSYHIHDVFTDAPFAGNPLAIVEGADGLSTAQMQTLARQFNLSETIFVQTPDDPAHTAKVRIFTPGAEIPFAGHPTIGCALHLAGGQNGTITLEERAGLVPVAITENGTLAEFTAPRIPAPIGTAPDAATIAAAIGLAPDRIGPHAPGAFEGGPAFLYAQLTDLAALAAASPCQPGWAAMMRAAGIDDTGRSAVGLYLYAPGEGCDWQARMFAPDDGIPEDPATGSATALLAGQLLANGALPEGTTTLHLRQGVEMGRPSSLRLAADVAGRTLSAIRVAGAAVPVATGKIRLP